MHEFKALHFFTYDSGIGIIDTEYGVEDKVIYQHFYGEKRGKISKAKVYYNSKGEAFFKSFNKRYYLYQFLKQ